MVSHLAVWVAVVFKSLSTFSMGFPQAERFVGRVVEWMRL